MGIRVAGIILLIVTSLSAQVPMTFQYFYDDTGQLIKVVDSTGVVIEYVYDPVGNMLEIKRSSVAAGGLSVFSFTPQRAGTLMLVTIQGQGFSPTLALNLVRFNGVLATVVSATSNQLVVQVPVGALAGAISVTVGANTSTSSATFTALPMPVITSVTPGSAIPGATIASFQVTGANLSGATFEFVPSFVPAAITMGPVSISASGTSATTSLTIGSTVGDFALVATNSFGSSSGFPSAANSLHLGQRVDVFGTVYSMLNSRNPAFGIPGAQQYVAGRVFSVLNQLNPSTGRAGLSQYVSSLTFSSLNGLNPGVGLPGSLQFVSGRAFSLLNTLNPSTGLAGSNQYVSGHVFSLLNKLNPSTGVAGSIQYSAGQVFSVLNSRSGALDNATPRFVNGRVFSIAIGQNLVGTILSPATLFTRLIVDRIANPSLLDEEMRRRPDGDGDGIADEDEIRLRTNPLNSDTDHDGYPDGLEIVLGSDPLNAGSRPNINGQGLVNSHFLSIQNFAPQARQRATGQPVAFRRNP